jgi:coenzyme PQQ precursor peptide PqqA
LLGNQTPASETIDAFGPVEEMTPEQGVNVAFKSLADRVVPAAPAVERLTPHARLVSAHRASSVKADFELTRLHRRNSLPDTNIRAKEMTMKWKAPVIIEIAVGLEINAYACAELK